MAGDIQVEAARSGAHVPKSLSRQGATQRDWLAARTRTVRRAILTVSFAAGALFTGLALRHSLQPAAPVQARSADPSNQSTTSQNQSSDVPSQSLFDDQKSNQFSIAPAPEVSSPRIRTVSS